VGQVFIAKQRYDAIGSRSNRVLSFEKGEELEVLAPTPGTEWWEVSLLFLVYVGDISDNLTGSVIGDGLQRRCPIKLFDEKGWK
jgi:hypothetical protein